MRRTRLLASLLALSSLCFATAHATPAAQVYTTGQVVPATLTFTDYQGVAHNIGEFKGHPLVLEWTNYGCPFVHKHYDSGNMQKLQATYVPKGVAWLSVISSAEGKQGFLVPKDAPGAIAKMGFKGSNVILDPTGTLGKAFGAETTPSFAILDAGGKLVYTGAIDSIPSFSKEDIAQATPYVANVLDTLLAGQPVATASTKSYGCSIKY